MPTIKQILLLEETPVDGAGTGQDEHDFHERAYHWMRTFVGLLGLALPLLLLFGGIRLYEGDAEVQGSLSAYYHTGMRDFFVGILAVIGFLLITYKIEEKTPENYWSQVGGIAAIGVALVPTGIPNSLKEIAALTPLQGYFNSKSLPWKPPWWSEKTTSEVLHYGFTILLILTLFVLCLGYMSQERRKNKWFWYQFHRGMAIAMIIAGIYVVFLAPLFNLFEDHRILLGEWTVVWAFGLSWLAKGVHREVLFPRQTS